jgi:hypothetical protein
MPTNVSWESAECDILQQEWLFARLLSTSFEKKCTARQFHGVANYDLVHKCGMIEIPPDFPFLTKMVGNCMLFVGKCGELLQALHHTL